MVAAVKLALLALALTLPMFACAATRTNTIPIRFGKIVLKAEVARTEPEREHGLMYRREMGTDDGMIFVFDEPVPASFWMKNTPLPLSIAFLDSNKVVLNVEEMAPFDEKTFHRAKGLALYAVEANKNWFESKGIKTGDKAVFELP